MKRRLIVQHVLILCYPKFKHCVSTTNFGRNSEGCAVHQVILKRC